MWDESHGVRYLTCRQCGQVIMTVPNYVHATIRKTCKRCKYTGKYEFFPIGFRTLEEEKGEENG